MLGGAAILCRRCSRLTQRRFLNLQEYQSKTLLRKNGCTVQNFFVAENNEDAKAKLSDTTYAEYVVKAQILAGGRGKGQIVGSRKNMRGVFITTSKNEVLESIGEMLNKRLVTKQTDTKGVLVKKVMVAESITITRETYLAILVDRESNGPVIVASPEGGVDIEDVAEKKPHLILKEPISIENGVSVEQCRRIAAFLQFPDEMIPAVAAQIENLYKLFVQVDATQIEINPLVQTDDNKVYCVDAKLNFDDNAAFRQKEIFSLENAQDELDVREVEAKKYHLNYIGLDGDIACLVNGAGLAMATLDIIKLFGGSPANFLDVGGAVTEEQVYNAFRILTMDGNVKAIFVNIFGGIVNCATIANGLVKALQRIQIEVPVVVRLEGTNVAEAKSLLKSSNLPLFVEHGLDEAARKVVEEAERYKNPTMTDLNNSHQKSAKHAIC